MDLFVLASERKRGMVTAFPELPPPTDRLGDLTEPERLVVGCFRRWLAGGTQREMLWRLLAHELAPGEARTALRGLEAMIRVLTAHARRNITYHQPCCPCIGPDEVGLLTLVTAVQRDQPALARLVGANFVNHEGLGVLLGAADLFASALKPRDLPLRFAYCAEPVAEAEAEFVPAPMLH
jgi:hypothetical protein